MENQNKLDINKDVPQTAILQKINEALKALGRTETWLKAPDFLPEYEALRGKKIILVDDVVGVLANIIPEYIVATDGSADAILHTGQSLAELVAEILAKNPEIVLMDYTLANDITGVEVISELKAQGYAGKVVGNSSEKQRGKEFARVGAIGSINKSAYPTSDSIKELAVLLGNK